MVVRVHDLDKWSVLKPGDVLQLNSEDAGPRRIRVEVNCPAPTRFDVSADGVLTFLAVVHGMEALEFTAAGTVELTATGEGTGEVWYFTDDGMDTTIVFEDAEVFTRIMNRQARNPAQEWAEFMLLQGERRRNAELAEFKAKMEARFAEQRERANGDAGADAAASGDDAAAASGGTRRRRKPEPELPAEAPEEGSDDDADT